MHYDFSTSSIPVPRLTHSGITGCLEDGCHLKFYIQQLMPDGLLVVSMDFRYTSNRTHWCIEFVVMRTVGWSKFWRNDFETRKCFEKRYWNSVILVVGFILFCEPLSDSAKIRVLSWRRKRNSLYSASSRTPFFFSKNHDCCSPFFKWTIAWLKSFSDKFWICS